MKYCIEEWTYPCEEGNTEEMIQRTEIVDEHDAMQYAWARLCEGFQVRVYIR